MRWYAVAIVLAIIIGVSTYYIQDAEAINPIKGYVSGGGTTVAVEISENGTATTTTPEDPPEEHFEQGVEG